MKPAAPRFTAILTAILIFTTAFPTIPIAQGRACGQIVGEFASATQGFIADADQANFGSVLGQAFKDYNKTLGTLADNSTQATVAVQLKDDFDRMKGDFEKVQGYHEALMDVWRCLAPGSACAERGLTSIRERLTDELRGWLDGQVDIGGLNAVRERVLEAANMIQRYTDRVMKISTDTMTAMQECTVPMRGQPHLSADTVPPSERVDADGLPEVAAPTPVPVDTDGGGSGTGTLLGVLGAAGAAGYGASALGLLGPKCAAEAPNNYHSTCESQGRNTSSCMALQNEYREWCSCLGRNFSYAGGCTGSR